MAEYIDREALIQELYAKLCALHGELDENRIVYDAFTDGFEECVGEVEKFQFAADVAPVMRGHWKKDRDTIKCTVCGFGMFPNRYTFMNGVCVTDNKLPKYCENCGAKMGIGADDAAD